MSGAVLVTGFGPFGDVADNPSGRVARAVDGARLGGVPVVGLELPVRYEEAVERTLEAARRCAATLVLGLGVASGRARAEVERRAVLVRWGPRDVSGSVETGLRGPAERFATLDADRLARALGAGVSDDAGTYVCNAWLYGVAGGLGAPVGFLHVPQHGIAVHRLLTALRVVLP